MEDESGKPFLLFSVQDLQPLARLGAKQSFGYSHDSDSASLAFIPFTTRPKPTPTSLSRARYMGGLCDVAPNLGAGLKSGNGHHHHGPTKGTDASISEGGD